MDKEAEKLSGQLSHFGASLEAVISHYGLDVGVKMPDGQKTKIDKGIYICPLCISACYYLEDATLNLTSDFTKDHFPPQSVGGNKWVLVCRKCNSSAGEQFDHTLKKYLAYLRFVGEDENAPYEVKTSFSGLPGKYRVTAKWENGVLGSHRL